jgi:hypothetical protein
MESSSACGVAVTDGVLQRAVGRDHGLQTAGQQIQLAVPGGEVAVGDVSQVRGIRLRRVSNKRRFQRHVQVVAAGDAAVVPYQRRDHVAVAVGVQDPFKHHVKAGVQCFACDRAQQGDVGAARGVVFPEHVPAGHVLAHDRDTAAVVISQALGHA